MKYIHLQKGTPHLSYFGGKPTWINKPQWPVDQNNDMLTFIMQLEIPNTNKIMYVFILADQDECFEDDETFYPSCDSWDPRENETAVIIQEKEKNNDTLVHTIEWENGPIAYKYPTTIVLNSKREDSIGNMGGKPTWLQDEEYPFADEVTWNFTVQIKAFENPHEFMLGDDGIMYIFTNKEQTQGALLWQCC